MPTHRSLLTLIALTSSFALCACAGAPTAPSVSAPTVLTAPDAAATAALMVQVDQVCAGRESDIRVFVDLQPIGVTNPGEPGVSRVVTVGAHQLSAISQRGTQWGPFPTTVNLGGSVERLGCMPAHGL